MSTRERMEPKEFGFKPLEERIVLDATLVFDIGKTTFLQEDYAVDCHDSLDTDFHDITESSIFFDGVDAQENGSDSEASALSWEEEDYSDFIVHNEPIYLLIDQGESHVDYDLVESYPAGDLLVQMGFLNFQIAQNSNPDLVSAKIEDTLLKLDYDTNETGDADLIVRGVYLDGKVYDTPFHIQIAAANDEQFDYDTQSETINPWLPAIYDNTSVDVKTEIFSLEPLTRSTHSEELGSLVAESQEAVKEVDGFFGKPSFEKGRWVKVNMNEAK